MSSNVENMLWAEKFRPRKIDDCILPEATKKMFKEFASKGELPQHLLITGSAGTGKTTIARALCNEIGADVLFVNGSEESGIDILRTKIRSFASTVSLTNAKKVVILDEADGTSSSFQPALRAFMEELSNNCRFILTCNFKNRIIEPIHSRCAVIEFKIENVDKPKIAAQFFKRITQILKSDGVEYEPAVVAELVNKHFPDFRRVLNELQRYSASGKIDTGILINLGDESFKTLVKHLKAKSFTEVRKWVGQNSDIETSALFRQLYDKSVDYLEQSSIPQLILILADYQHRAAFVADPEINVMACMVEIMSSCKFKE